MSAFPRTAGIPKVELHVHLEGSIAPALLRRLAARNGIALPPSLIAAGERYPFADFAGFLDAFDRVAGSLRSAVDYRDATEDYLLAIAAEGAIYAELMFSPDHAERCGVGFEWALEGIAEGLAAAERKSGIVARLIVTCVRHLGPQQAFAVAERMVAAAHPLVVGLGLAGDETQLAPADFAPAFARADAAGYATTAHAGEVCGAESVRATLDALPVSRMGHGVRAAEDPRLLEEIARRGIHLEVCPGSNVALGLYADRASHPLPKLLAAGCSLTLNSDDPPFFATSLGQEYEEAARVHGLTDSRLLEITRQGLEAAFVDAETKNRLLAKLDDASAPATRRQEAGR